MRLHVRQAIHLGLASIIFSAGCQPESTPADLDSTAELDHSHFHPTHLAGEDLQLSDVVAIPTLVRLVGSRLVVLDLASDSVVHMFDMSGAHIASLGRRGQGPGEFQSAWSVTPDPTSQVDFWVHDVSLSRLTRVVPAAAAGSPAEVGPIVRLNARVRVQDPAWTDSFVVAAGFSQSHRLAYFDHQGRAMPVAGNGPEEEVAYQSRMAIDPSRTRLVTGTRWADLLDIYDAGGNHLVRQRLFNFESEITHLAETRFGYIDLSATDDHIFALFSGRTRVGDPGEANFGRHVHVYQWDGTLAAVYILESPALSLAVDEAGATLFTVRHDPEPSVVRYPLPPITAPLTAAAPHEP